MSSAHGAAGDVGPTILHLVTSRRWTGVAEPVLQLACEQAAAGARPLIALERGGEFEERVAASGIEIVDGLVRHSDNPVSWWSRRGKMKRFLASREIDIVHAHLTSDHWMAAAAMGGRDRSGGSRPKLVRTWHREETPRADPLSRWVAGRTDGFIAISSTLAAALRERLSAPSERLLRTGGVVDTDAFKPGGAREAKRAEWGIGADVPLAGLLCRQRRARGTFEFMDAAEPLHTALPDAHLVWCGRGRHADELRTRLETHPRRANLHYPGYSPPDTLNDAYAAFDIAVQLAPGNDGTCRAALQSMACGRPLVAAARGALADLLHHDDGRPLRPEQGGILVPPDDPVALAEALARYLGDPDLCHRAGDAARQLMERRHRPADHARTVLAFYARLSAL